MKLIHQILLGLLVGGVLSFAVVALTAPQPVLTQKTVITPVPTPRVIYITVTPTPTQIHEDQPPVSHTREKLFEEMTDEEQEEYMRSLLEEPMDVVFTMLPFIVVAAIGIFAMIVIRVAF